MCSWEIYGYTNTVHTDDDVKSTSGRSGVESDPTEHMGSIARHYLDVWIQSLPQDRPAYIENPNSQPAI